MIGSVPMKPYVKFQSPRRLRLGFAFVILGSSLVWLSACGKGFNQPMTASSEARAQLPVEPTEKTYPSLPSKYQPKNKAYSIYQVLEAKVGADMSRNEISARVFIESTAGKEEVELLGRIRTDGSSTLVDINPLEDGQYRVTAEAYCVDRDECKKIIVNLVYKVGTKTIRKQFVTKPLIQAPAPAPAPADSHASPNTAPPSPAGNNSAHRTTESPAPTRAQHNQQPPAQASQPELVYDEEHDPLDEGSDDPNSELNGSNQMGEYVGAQPPQEVIEKLWQRPVDPKPGDVPQREEITDAPRGPIQIEPLPPQANEPIEVEPPNDDEAPAQPTSGKDSESPTAPTAGSDNDPGVMPLPGGHTKTPQTRAQQNQQPQAPSSAQPHAPAAPSSAPTAAKPAPAEQSSDVSAPTPGHKPNPPPQETPKSPSTKKEDIAPSQSSASAPEDTHTPARKPEPPPYTAVAPEVKKDPISDFEFQIAPLMNIIDGGRAVGPHMTTRNPDGTIEYGSLRNANELPDEGIGFRKVYPQRDRDFGTGMLVSLIQNASAYLVQKYYPDAVVVIGDLAQKKGGPLRGSGHKSHQSGLDVDIPYIGTFQFESVVSGSRLKSNFEYAKNWQYFRLLASQQIVLGGKQQTALNRIFVGPAVKRGFCAWAKKNGLTSQPLDADILRRLRVEAGHNNHFHVRLKCSPHYPACRNQVDPPSGTGC